MVIIFQIIRHRLSINQALLQTKNGVKIAVLLKYSISFWRSLEMWLISCKVELSLTWNPNGNGTLSTKDILVKDLKDQSVRINTK